jgi:hypothetical protein
MSGITQAIRRLLSPSPQGMKMTDYATAEFTAQCKLDDANAALNDPPEGADIAALMAARDAALQELKVLKARKDKAANDAHRAGIAARGEAFRSELDAELSALRELLPRIRYHLSGLALLEPRLSEEGSGRSWEEFTGGLRYGASDRILVAIAREIDPRSDWNDVWTPPGLLAGLVAGREYSRRKAEERAAREAEAQAEFDRKLAAFERGESREDPRIVTYRVRAGR